MKPIYKKGDKVLTQDSFGRSYIGTVVKVEELHLKSLKRPIVEVYIQDSSGQILPRNIKHVKGIRS